MIKMEETKDPQPVTDPPQSDEEEAVDLFSFTVVEEETKEKAADPSLADPPIVEYRKDSKLRRVMMVINDPVEHGFDHDTIKAALADLPSLMYWCMADEVGNETQRFHTHLYVVAKYGIRFSVIKNHFPTAHIQAASCFSNSTDCRNYILKEGKWEGTKKADTKVKGSFEQWGILPKERPGARTDLEQLYQEIREGKTTANILKDNPEHIMKISQIERARTVILEAAARTERRTDLEVIYVTGGTGVGKTRALYDTFPANEIYRITDYNHPFDGYTLENIMVFEEFRSSLPIGDMLSYLDIYPLSLPARYSNRVAAYHRVFIISNWGLEEQYANVQRDSPATWKAFLRRIHNVRVYTGIGEYTDYTMEEYLEDFHKVAAPSETPFSPETKEEQMILAVQKGTKHESARSRYQTVRRGNVRTV